MKLKFSDGTELVLADTARQSTEWHNGARHPRIELAFAKADATALTDLMDKTDPMVLLGDDGSEVNRFERYTVNIALTVTDKAVLSATQEDFSEVIEAREAKAKAAQEVAAAQAAQAQAEQAAQILMGGETA